ncbi:MAG: LegC family aminotransferase [Gammaproteobacteria bacterium]|nr:LegC family aminotransferase [Gammaproteobacteria bacterium]
MSFIKTLYKTTGHIPLHQPIFSGNEKKYLSECIDSTFVSSVGKFVDQFELMVAEYTGAKYAIATVNGTAALHVALKLSGVDSNCEVITQPLTFVATCNAISYCGATPVFVDVDRNTLGMSPDSLQEYLDTHAIQKNGECFNKTTGRRITSVLPVHTFGHPCRVTEIQEICKRHNLIMVEDAAEGLGSFYKGRHTGTFGKIGVISFNGNKTITTGGGGILLTDDKQLAKSAKHITTTARVPHEYEYIHDEVGYNYRLPNINAALGCAQMEMLESILEGKKKLTKMYDYHFSGLNIGFLRQPEQCSSNYWLNAVILDDEHQKNVFLKETNESGVMTRPVWRLMNSLDIYSDCQSGPLENAYWLYSRVVNIPSTVRLK